jgi:hypothetical protein
LLHGKIDVLDPQPDRFHNPQPAAVEQFGDQLRRALHEHEDGGDGNFALQSEVGVERLDLGFGGEEVRAGPHPVKPGEASDPFHMGALCVDGVMLHPEDPPDLLDQGRWGTVLRVGHKKISVLVSYHR